MPRLQNRWQKMLPSHLHTIRTGAVVISQAKNTFEAVNRIEMNENQSMDGKKSKSHRYIAPNGVKFTFFSETRFFGCHHAQPQQIIECAVHMRKIAYGSVKTGHTGHIDVCDTRSKHFAFGRFH